MGKIENEEFICVDCETTGLDLDKDRIIEVAAVRFNMNEILAEMETLVDPERDIPAESIKIHNITEEMVKDQPKIRAVLPELLEFIGDYTIVGHGIDFDINMIANAAERAGVPCKIKKNQVIDTLRMARLYGESAINSLQHLRKHFNIQPEGAHRAMSDVVVNVDVFRQLAKEYPTTEKLFQTLSKPIRLKVMPLGKHKGRKLSDIPLNYLLWAAKLKFDKDLTYTIRSEIKRRKQGDLFSQAGNPFNEL